MKSLPGNGRLTFAILQQRLISAVNIRVRNGDFTERGLSRILGVSQPQIHNVLKGARRLQPAFADRILGKFGLTILDLLEDREISAEALSRENLKARSPFRIGNFTNLYSPVKLPPEKEMKFERIPKREAS